MDMQGFGDPNDPVDPEVWLYRRVSPLWVERDDAGALVLHDGEPIIQSWAFDDQPKIDGGMSVVIGDWLNASGRSPEDLLDGFAGYGLVKIRARDVASIDGLTIERTPLPDEPAHGDVKGKKTGGRRKKLRDAAEWEIPVPG